MGTPTRRPRRTELKPLDFISWPNGDRVETQRVQQVHPGGVVLRDQWGYVDQHDSLPSRWRMATDGEIAEYRGSAAMTDTATPAETVSHRVLKLRFTVPAELTDDEVHDMGERIITDLVTAEPVTFDSTEVVDES